jgi:PIN domain nuclease of toxin-antitoxin system
VRLLLDTHVFLWWRCDAPELGDEARQAIHDKGHEVCISVIVGWEIVIKRALGKLELDGTVAEAVAEEGFTPWPVEMAHVDEVARLPPHHLDPFDRLLVAQARVDGLVLVSADPLIQAYDGLAHLDARAARRRRRRRATT